MSGRRDREARREERQQEERQAGASERRQRMIKLASAVAFLALVVVAVLIVISQSQNSGGDSGNIADAKLVNQELAGIPQDGMVLGDPAAKVTVLEFGDLQCPVCKGYAEEVLPQVIENQVQSGRAKLDFRNFTIISEQSTPAGAAAIAAGEQGRGWNFVELFYRNQGEEASGYADDEFLTAIARAAGVSDLAKWNRDRKSRRIVSEVEATTAEAEQLGFTGTPSFALKGPATSGTEPIGTPDSAEALESAIDDAGGR
ncbi:MAG TPA: thioredoxin domain-containing protein [Solirubrobacterales bacterium]|nr:thioredoxin domain-containing protein [Solirubrobacterales bacterium]